MSVALIHWQRISSGGGAEYYIRVIAKYLQLNNVEVNILTLRTHSDILGNDKALSFLEKCDVVHINNATIPTLLYLIQKLKRPRIVYTLHNGGIIDPKYPYTNVRFPEGVNCIENISLSKRCMRCLMQNDKLNRNPLPENIFNVVRAYASFNLRLWLMRQVDAIVVPSKWMLLKLSNLRLSNTVLFRNPLEINDIFKHFNCKTINLRVSKNYVLFIGRLIEEKGVKFLPLIAKRIQRYGISLLIIGKGSMYSFLEKMCNRSRVSNMKIMGFVSEDQKYKLMHSALALIVPSIWAEAFGYTVVESFSVKKPIITFNLGGQGELAKESQGGLVSKLFDLDEFSRHIVTLHENPEIAERLGENGYKWLRSTPEVRPEVYIKKLIKEVYRLR